MPSSTKKQLNYFKLVQAYKKGGYKGFFAKWQEMYGNRPFPETSYIDKIVKTSKTIKDADLEDMTSGIKGDEVLGDDRNIKVGYWALFNGAYKTDLSGEKKSGKFIAKIKRVDMSNNIANFNSDDIYNRFGKKIMPVYRASITSTEFKYLDYAKFDDIVKTGKSIQEVSEEKPKQSIANEMFGDYKAGDYTGMLAEKLVDTGQNWEEMLKQRKEVLSKIGKNELEPQVKDAVEKLNRHGYITSSSGFILHKKATLAKGTKYPVHTIDGIMNLSDEQINAINKSNLGDVVRLDDFILGYQAIRVVGDNDLNKVKEKFDKIVDIIVAENN